jgi:argininosuccinate synthase
MWRWSVSPQNAPNEGEEVIIEFEQGDPVKINNQSLPPHEILNLLNVLGGKHGVGRLDLVENRFVGMKSRGCYETPGGTILLKAHRAIESLTLDREVAHLKDDLMPRYASLIYNGFWWSPEREALQKLIDHTQENVTGVIKLRLYKGNIEILSRESSKSLFDAEVATFEDDEGAYDQKDASGFIKLNALRLRIGNKKNKK